MKLEQLFESDLNTKQILREWYSVYGNFLYRGSSKKTDDILEVIQRADRTGTSQEEHYEFDEFLEKDFGYKFRNGLFCTINLRVASHYGTPHIIIPKDFVCLWNSKIDDLYTDFNKSKMSFDNFYYEKYKPYCNTSMMDYLKEKQSSEISIICKSYYVINIAKYSDFIKYEL